MRFAALAVLMSCCAACTSEESRGQKEAQSWGEQFALSLPNPPWKEDQVIVDDPSRRLDEQFDASELVILERRALNGDGVSAWLLRQYYAQSRPPNFDEADKWERIAAENGQSEAETMIGLDYQQAGGEENCRRASFWLQRAGASEFEVTGQVGETTFTNLLSLAESWESCLTRRGSGGVDE